MDGSDRLKSDFAGNPGAFWLVEAWDTVNSSDCLWEDCVGDSLSLSILAGSYVLFCFVRLSSLFLIFDRIVKYVLWIPFSVGIWTMLGATVFPFKHRNIVYPTRIMSKESFIDSGLIFVDKAGRLYVEMRPTNFKECNTTQNLCKRNQTQTVW